MKDTFGKSIAFETISTDLGMVKTSCRVSDNAVDQIFLNPARDHNDLKSPIMLGVKLNPTPSDALEILHQLFSGVITTPEIAAEFKICGPKNLKRSPIPCHRP